MGSVKQNINVIFSVLIILVLFFGVYVFADTNGIWTLAKDIRGGTFGGDEQSVTGGYSFINPVTFNKNVSMKNLSLGNLNSTNINSQNIYSAKVNANDVSTNKLCIQGTCYTSWADSLVYTVKYEAGLNYDFGAATNFKRDSTYHYPYLTFRDMYQKYGLADAYSTNWFPLAFSLWQPYTQYLTSFYMEEGDNSAPRNYYGSRSPTGKIHPADVFIFCAYSENGVRYSRDLNFCESKNSVWYYFRDSTKPSGQVLLQLSLRDASGSCPIDYLPLMSIATWSSPNIIYPRISSYVYPQKSLCYGANLHSYIMGRFVVNNNYYAGTKSTLASHYNAGEQITYSFKTIGLTYLKTH